jgi:hypothetical protein
LYYIATNPFPVPPLEASSRFFVPPPIGRQPGEPGASGVIWLRAAPFRERSTGAGRLSQSPSSRIRWLAVTGSILLSLWFILINDKINPDGALYVDTAQRLIEGDWQGAYRLYLWPFFSLLMALLSQATGLHPEAAALALNLLFAAVMVYAFVALVEELGGDRKTIWFAAFVILSLPYVNEKRAEVIRDIGYWAFVVTSLLLFLRFGARPGLGRGLAWSLSALIATLFRIEGFAALLALPWVLWLQGGWSWRQRALAFLQANVLVIGLAAALAVIVALDPEIANYSGRLLEPIQRLEQFWVELSSGLERKADLLRSQVFDLTTGPYAHYAGKSALTVLVGGLVTIVVIKAAKVITPLYWLLPMFRRFRYRLHFSPLAVRTLAWLFLINLSLIFAFVVDSFYLSSRYVVPLALTLLPAVPFVLAAAHDRWRELARAPWRRKWVFPLIALGLLATLLDGVIVTSPPKTYIKEAGLWLRERVPADQRVYTNASLVHYYSGQGITWTDRRQYRLPPHIPLYKYDYAAVEKKRGEFPRAWNKLLKLGGLTPVAEFENRRGDGIRIYRIDLDGPPSGKRRLRPESEPKPERGN